MKILQSFLISILLLTLGCNEGYIDDISAVDPGEDLEAPTVDISFPLEGTQIRVVEEVTSINISFEASDDIEIQTVVVQLDGEQIATYNEFIDFRKFIVDSLGFDQLTNGSHVLNVSVTDLAGKNTVGTINFEKLEPYRPQYDGEVFYLPFDGEYIELVSLTTATITGSPGFSTDDKVAGTAAYQGTEDSYISFPTTGLTNNEFSASFWMKINDTPDRAGILVIGPLDEGNPDSQNNRVSGFRFFRELDNPNVPDDQRFKLNIGNGAGDNWFDGGENADIDPGDFPEWQHFAFSIGSDMATVYINGEVVSTNAFPGVNWDGCDIFTIMSGVPRFTGWGHLSDLSLMDELRIFDKALTQEEVQTIMNAEMPN